MISQFSTQQNLIKHARLHTGERPYPCPINACKWAYKQKGDLLAHIQRGKHGTSSDNNRKPPTSKFYHGSTKLPTLHAISKQDIDNSPDLKNLIIALRKREETKKLQKEKVKQKRKNQLDDFVLSMFLSIYEVDNYEMKNLLNIASEKFNQKILMNQAKERQQKDDEKKCQIEVDEEMDKNDNNNNNQNNNNNKNPENNYLKMDSLPNAKKSHIKYKYLVNRVYGDYSIVLVPVNSVPSDEIFEATPEIIIDPNNIPALQSPNTVDNSSDGKSNEEILNSINPNPWKGKGRIQPPPSKRRKLNNPHNKINSLEDNNIVLAKGNGLKNGRVIGHMPRFVLLFFDVFNGLFFSHYICIISVFIIGFFAEINT